VWGRGGAPRPRVHAQTWARRGSTRPPRVGSGSATSPPAGCASGRRAAAPSPCGGREGGDRAGSRAPAAQGPPPAPRERAHRKVANSATRTPTSAPRAAAALAIPVPVPVPVPLLQRSVRGREPHQPRPSASRKQEVGLAALPVLKASAAKATTASGASSGSPQCPAKQQVACGAQTSGLKAQPLCKD
jgi:hypothetical protein